MITPLDQEMLMNIRLPRCNLEKTLWNTQPFVVKHAQLQHHYILAPYSIGLI